MFSRFVMHVLAFRFTAISALKTITGRADSSFLYHVDRGGESTWRSPLFLIVLQTNEKQIASSRSRKHEGEHKAATIKRS